MKNRLALGIFTFLLSFQVTTAQDLVYKWSRGYGGNDFDTGTSLATDSDGNTIVAGWFLGTLILPNSSDTLELASSGGTDIFIAKLNPNGDYLWAFSLGGSFNDGAEAVTVDEENNIYVVGKFSSTVDFDPTIENTTLQAYGAADLFLAKYSSTGALSWVKNMGGSDIENGTQVELNSEGEIFVGGLYRGLVDLDPSEENNGFSAVGWNDMFVAKYDDDGNFMWANSIGGSEFDFCHDMTAATDGGVYFTGSFEEAATCQFQDSLFVLESAGFSDMFIAKCENNGDLSWLHQFGGPQRDEGLGVATDTSGNVLLTGTVSFNIDINPSPDVLEVLESQWGDIFLTKLTPNGEVLWGKSMGGIEYDRPSSITLDNDENIYISGEFEGTADFDPSLNENALVSNGSADGFLAKYDNSGNHIWSYGIGGISEDRIKDVYIHNGNARLLGDFMEVIGFGFPLASDSLSSHGDMDFFISSIDICEDIPLLITEVDNVLSVTEFENATYQWVECSGSIELIEGENESIFTPLENGNYAVEVNLEGCSFTSPCYEFIETGVLETETTIFTVYPNPSKGSFIIESNIQESLFKLEVFDSKGKIVTRMSEIPGRAIVDLNTFSNGVYWMRLVSQNGFEVKRLVKY